MTQAESQIKNATLYACHIARKPLPDCVDEYVKTFGEGFAVLYTPSSCYLTRLDSHGIIIASSGKENEPAELKKDVLRSVFEARIFNEAAEMRWLNRANGEHKAVVLSESQQTFFDGAWNPVSNIYAKIVVEVDSKFGPAQDYLLWGESIGSSLSNGWTQFAEARIGSFFVPISDNKISDKNRVRACFTAIEYLGEYEDGNVAVAEERLTGIKIV